MQKLELTFIKIIIRLLAFVPFPLLYLISDGLFFLLYYFIRYRRKVVYDNLKRSFPGKSTAEIHQLHRSFYRYFCDMVLESIKGFSLPEPELRKRFVYTNPEIFEDLYRTGRSAILLGSHYGNWEWGVLSFPLVVDHTVVGVYKPLNNKAVDAYLNDIRRQWGLHLTPMQQTGRALINYAKQPCIFVLIADQTPSDVKNAHWIPFLNQDTPFLHGAEKMARRTGYPVYMFEIDRINRGYYEVTFREISAVPGTTVEPEITRSFARQLESSIRKYPPLWLWSHRRWKRKRS